MKKLASFLLYLISTIAILFGLLYIFTPKIMPYHEVYLGMSHEQLPPKIAALLLSALRVIGFLLISLGLALGVVTKISLTKGHVWSWWLVFGCWLIALAPLLVITLRIGLHTPWWLVATMIVLLLVAAFLTRPER